MLFPIRHFSTLLFAAALLVGLTITPPAFAEDDTPAVDSAAEAMITKLPAAIAPVEHNFPITTSSPEAQDLFNKGLRLAYQMQPLEAFETFIEATQVDPDCGMCYWGAALVLGPNLTTPMDPVNNSQAFELSQKALTYQKMVSGIEEDLIIALAARYAEGSNDANRAELDAAYSEAMRVVSRKYPMNDDVLTLLAAALMNERQQMARKPPAELPQKGEILDILQEALALNPDNPGANQFYDEAMKAGAEETAIAAE